VAETVRPSERIPALELRDARDERKVRLRAPELGSMVLWFPHAVDCVGCRRYLDQLSAAETAFRHWDGRLIAVLPGTPEAAVAAAATSRNHSRFSIVADPERALARSLGLSGDADLLIADRFGECFHAARAAEGDHDALPAPDEVERWLTYLGTQCPECGVPDTAADGEWEVGG
jgi:peroxiredoxin